MPKDEEVRTFGGARYTIEHHKPPPDDGPPPLPSWDATHGHQPPPPSKEKVQRVLKEEVRRSASEAKRLLAFTRSAWDSTRPAGDPNDAGLCHFALRWSANEHPAAVRDGTSYETRTEAATEHPIHAQREQRRAANQIVTWNSSRGKPFVPLGAVPLVPSAVVRQSQPTPLTLLGEVFMPEKLEEKNATVELALGVPVEHSVPRNGRRFYCVRMDEENRQLTVRLRAWRGDPDLYVCTLHARPDEERHTWKSNGTGEHEEISIGADDPRGGAGKYYIGVFGEKASDYRIEASIVKPKISLPARSCTSQFDTESRKLVAKAVRGSASRLVQAYSSTPNAHEAVLSSLDAHGLSQVDLLEAARPASRILRAHSDLALQRGHGVPLLRAVGGLTRSLATLPTSHSITALPTRKNGRGSSAAAPTAVSEQPPLQQEQDDEEDAAGERPGAGGKGGAAQVLTMKGAGAGGPETAIEEMEAVPPSTRRTPLSDPAFALVAPPTSAGVAGLRTGPPPELSWQPPPGYTWEDLPKDARLRQAMAELKDVRGELTDRLRSQLAGLEETRPYKYVARTQALASVDAQASVCRVGVVRRGAEAILHSFARLEEDEAAQEAAAAAARAAPPPAVPASVRVVAASERALLSSNSLGTLFQEHPAVRSIDGRYKDQRRKPTPKVRGRPMSEYEKWKAKRGNV
jgi:hypothetical protein